MNKIRKTIKLIKTNKENLSKILVSEDFMLKISQFPLDLEIEVKSVSFSKEDSTEEYFLFGIPLVYSNILNKDAVLITKKGENIILKNI